MTRSTIRSDSGGTWLALLVSVAVCLGGCGRPAKLSDDGFSIARTLYSICNLQKTEQLQAVSTIVTQHATQGTLTEREAEQLRAIIAQGERGQWKQAQARVRKLLAAQNVSE